MADMLQKIFSNSFPCMKIVIFFMQISLKFDSKGARKYVIIGTDDGLAQNR